MNLVLVLVLAVAPFAPIGDPESTDSDGDAHSSVHKHADTARNSQSVVSDKSDQEEEPKEEDDITELSTCCVPPVCEP